MKPIQIISLITLVSTLFSCDSEDARTPLGITISAPDFETEIPENPDADIVLTTLSAIASDGSTIQYGNIIEADSEDSKFESETPIGALDIDNVTGELTIKDVSQFDFDLNTEINAIVNAYSGNVSEAITINIFLEEFLDLNSDREALIEIYESNIDSTRVNPNPLIDWVISETDETDIRDWTGVIITNERVTGLDLSSGSLTQIPTNISRLSELTTLNLSDNQLTDLPESIVDLENLISLDISSNDILQLSTTICEAFDNDEISFIKDINVCNDDPETITP